MLEGNIASRSSPHPTPRTGAPAPDLPGSWGGSGRGLASTHPTLSPPVVSQTQVTTEPESTGFPHRRVPTSLPPPTPRLLWVAPTLTP